MTVKPEEVLVGTLIRVKQGKASRDFLAGRSSTLGGGSRPPFGVWPVGRMWEHDGSFCSDGESFEVLPGPRRGRKPVYSYPEVSGKFVSLKRLSDGAVVETHFVNVRFDAEVVR